MTTWITAGELFCGAAKSRDPIANRKLVERFLERKKKGLDEIQSISREYAGARGVSFEPAEGRWVKDEPARRSN